MKREKGNDGGIGSVVVKTSEFFFSFPLLFRFLNRNEDEK